MTRAFVVGNGPSLNATPLELLKDEVTFGLNRIHLHYPKTRWRPTYWVYTDVQDMPDNEWINDCLFHLKQPYHSFIWSNLTTMLELKRGAWDPWQPSKVTWIPLCMEHVSMDNNHPHKPKAWHLPTLCKFGTGSAVALQLAVLKRYNPIYVVGMDLGFKPKMEGGKDPNHMSEDYMVWDMHCQHQVDANRKNATHVHAHQLALKACEERGIKIYNAGIGGDLNVYPRVDLEEVMHARVH